MYGSRSPAWFSFLCFLVYCGNRLSMPVPLDIATHKDFKRVFKNVLPYCTVKETKQFLKTLQIENQEAVYHVLSW